MSKKKLPADFEYLPDMYSDQYFPNFLVDKITDLIKGMVVFIEEGDHSTEEIQGALDQMTSSINELQKEFEENDSEIETVARDSIGVTVEKILKYFDVNIDIEEAIRERDW
jgi:methyl-accepting chemotaxis protein